MEVSGTVEQLWRVNAPDVISETIEGETIILHLGNGFYFSAGGAGALAWRLLSESVLADEVVFAVSLAYDAPGVDVASAVEEFVAELSAEGLLVTAESGGAAPPPPPHEVMPWAPPTLSKFTDMEDLLLLDPVHEVSPTQGWPNAASARGGAA